MMCSLSYRLVANQRAQRSELGRKFEYDLWYVKNQSFFLDFKILLITLKKFYCKKILVVQAMPLAKILKDLVSTKTKQEPPLKILGISHDILICSACLVKDGKIIAAIPEERLDRVKQSRNFPIKAIHKCLEIAKLSLEDIDEVAIAWNPSIDLETLSSGFIQGRRNRSEHLMQVPAQLISLSQNMVQIL